MSNHPSCLDESSINKIRQLQNRVGELEAIERKYLKTLRELTEKEAFNFALFQYNPSQLVVVDSDGKVVKSNIAKKKSDSRLPDIGNVMYRDYASHHTIDMHEQLMEAMSEGTTRRFPQLPYGKKILSITIAPFPQGAIIISEDITEQKKVEAERTHLINDLRHALDEVETLRGLLPICASCKKIRDDQGYWNHIEVYLSNHSDVDFTHTLCPDCIRHLYPEYWQKIQQRSATVQKTR
jgi:hypothetical protein